MSLPEMPKDCDLTLEDAVNLLLKSIASEELSLSKLLDVERLKILHTLNRPDICPQSLIEINNSVDQTIKDITKLQMLLQFKLESVSKLIPKYECVNPCAICCCISEKKISGKAEGKISDGFNEFYRKNALLVFEAYQCDSKKSVIRYQIGAENPDIILLGNVNEVKICDDKLTLKGEGKCTRNTACKAEGGVKYVLIINFCECVIHTFDMIIISKNSILQHRSGIITTECSKIDFE